MKTTVDIPEKELKELMRLSKAKTKKEAILKAIYEYNRRHRLERLAGMLGTFRDIISQEELERIREDHKWPRKS
ncbi:MAG: type II toxin-antitoxin system VapB family antitoxin [Nitrospirae bacterium]|nr:type II toxin-antitoxin system VapB family antitoxin [Nitrospirota bacterium]